MKTVVGGKDSLEYAAFVIKEGGLVAFPTETVYGLGADAFNKDAVKSIFLAKGRPNDNPLIVHISDIKQLTSVAKDVPETAYKLFEKFSPGPLSLVLPKHRDIPYETTAGLDTVAVRIPRHELALELIRLSCPIAAPSANSSGRVSPTEASHVFEDMNGKIPLILDGGSSDVGIESTVLDLTKDIPEILRPGYITEDMLLTVLNRVMTSDGKIKVAKSPGMKYRHYAPLCPTKGAETPADADCMYGCANMPVIIASGAFLNKCASLHKINLGNTAAECAKNLFSALRRAEKEYQTIILEIFPDAPEYGGLNNRILKAIER